jgi:predicted acyltransferase (DUF342 family)
VIDITEASIITITQNNMINNNVIVKHNVFAQDLNTGSYMNGGIPKCNNQINIMNSTEVWYRYPAQY